MGIHQWGSESSWPFFLSSSDENSLSNALSNEAVKEKLPKEVPTCLMDPSVFVICRAVAWSTFSTWHAAPALLSWCFLVVAFSTSRRWRTGERRGTARSLGAGTLVRPRRRRRGDAASRRRHRRDGIDGVAATRTHEDDEDAASKPFLATATKPYFSKPLAAHSAADGIGASMHKMSACALLESYS